MMPPRDRTRTMIPPKRISRTRAAALARERAVARGNIELANAYSMLEAAYEEIDALVADREVFS